MLLTFDFSSDTPLYIQLRNQIVIGIAQGRLRPGEKLPTVRALAEDSGINMMTASKAYQLLKQEGYISTDRRGGTTVCGQKGSAPPAGGAAQRPAAAHVGAAPGGNEPGGRYGALRQTV